MALASASEWVGTTGTGEDGTVVTTEPQAVLPPRLNRSLSLRKDSIAFWPNALSSLCQGTLYHSTPQSSRPNMARIRC